jgi:TonB family protein
VALWIPLFGLFFWASALVEKIHGWILKVDSDMPQSREIKRVEPVSPEEYRKEGVGGSVLLDVLIDEKGAVQNVLPSQSADPRLSQAAVEAVKKWQFTPATESNRQVPAITTVTTIFSGPPETENPPLASKSLKPIDIKTVKAVKIDRIATIRSKHEDKTHFQGKLLKPIDVQGLTIGEDREIAKIDSRWTRDFEPVAICWSPDDSRLLITAVPPMASDFSTSYRNKEQEGGYLYPSRAYPGSPVFPSTSDLNFGFTRSISISASGSDFRVVKTKPDWAVNYWRLKSSKISYGGVAIEKRKRPGAYELSGWCIGSGYPGYSYSWSPPGGRAIVFGLGTDFSKEHGTFIMSEDGKERRKISEKKFNLPAWSNDGKKIAFLSYGLGYGFGIWRVFMVELSGIEYQDGK